MKRQIKFVETVVTAQNPKDLYYINSYRLERTYYIMMLIGIVLFGYVMLT